MTSFIAFLRGINIGGRKVLMQDLQKVFEELQLANIKTVIASGNVLFDADQQDEQKLSGMIETALKKKFGFRIPVILRSKEEIQKIIEKEPFKNTILPLAGNDEIKVRFQVTLFAHQVTGEFPLEGNGFKILALGERELGSVVYPEGKTTDLMTFIDKTFGKESTTRNWNTLMNLRKM